MLKNLINTSALVLLFLFLSSNIIDSNEIVSTTPEVAIDGGSLEARVNTYKYQCKQLIKPHRYEGSRVTYYAPSKDIQTKSVESYLILDTEYRFAFSGKESSVDISVKIYESENKKVLLGEVKNIKGNNVVVSSKDLMPAFRKKLSKTERLKSIFIEYTIPSGSTKNEAIVLVIGYKD